jgi:hypothetical protein
MHNRTADPPLSHSNTHSSEVKFASWSNPADAGFLVIGRKSLELSRWQDMGI